MSTVMIVDDSRTMRKMLAGTLTSEGYEIVGNAGNGEEALKLLDLSNVSERFKTTFLGGNK